MKSEEWFEFIEGLLVSKTYPCHFGDEERGGEIYERLRLAFVTPRVTEKTQRNTERMIVKN